MKLEDNAIEAIFNKFDVDGSGAVETHEMRKMLEALHFRLTDDELAQIMRDADIDSSGCVSLTEFKNAISKVTATGSLSVGLCFESLHAVFDAFDADGGGKVSVTELAKMCERLDIKVSKDELQQMMKDADHDGCGEIDFGEFVVAVGSKLDQGSKFVQMYQKAVKIVMEAREEGADWTMGVNLLEAAQRIARAKKPERRAFVGTPANASYAIAAELGTPEDAICLERARDQILGFFVRCNKFFMVLAVMSGICVVGFGVLIVIMMFSAIFGLEFSGLADILPECASEQQTCDLYLAGHPDAGYSSDCSELQYHPADYKSVDRMGPDASTLEGLHGHCTRGQHWFNICIKVFTIIFSYINLLPIPWRVSILIDALRPGHRTWIKKALRIQMPASRLQQRSSDVHVGASGGGSGDNSVDQLDGCDFYGRPTEALWFHLPRRSRAHIAICLNIGWVAHYASLGAHVYYWDYWDTQTWPGVLAANLPFVTSIIFPIIGGVIQGKAEAKVVAANPKRFPPEPGKYIKAAWAEYRQELKEDNQPTSARGGCSCRFWKHLKAQLEQMKKDQEQYESMTGISSSTMSGIVVQKKPKHFLSRSLTVTAVGLKQLGAEIKNTFAGDTKTNDTKKEDDGGDDGKKYQTILPPGSV